MGDVPWEMLTGGKSEKVAQAAASLGREGTQSRRSDRATSEPRTNGYRTCSSRSAAACCQGTTMPSCTARTRVCREAGQGLGWTAKTRHARRSWRASVRKAARALECATCAKERASKAGCCWNRQGRNCSVMPAKQGQSLQQTW